MISNEDIFGNCSLCKEMKGIIRCQDCICDILCNECDRTVHAAYPYHDRIAHLDGYQYVLSPLEEIDSQMQIVHSSKIIYNVLLKLSLETNAVACTLACSLLRFMACAMVSLHSL